MTDPKTHAMTRATTHAKPSARGFSMIELLLARLSEENWDEVAKRMETLEEMRRDLERRDAE